jgi:hypothetical protein
MSVRFYQLVEITARHLAAPSDAFCASVRVFAKQDGSGSDSTSTSLAMG